MRVYVTNAYRGNKLRALYVARLAAGRPAAILGSEFQAIRWIPGYRRLGAPKSVGWEANDCAIFVRRDLEVLEWGYEQVTTAVPDRPVQHARWIVHGKVRRRGQRGRHRRNVFGLVAVHANAAIQLPDGSVPDSPGARRNKAIAEHVATLAAAYRSHGIYPIIGGDWNYQRPRTAAIWAGAPHIVLPRNMIAYYPEGVDGLGYADLDLTDFLVLRAPGSDHPLLSARLRPVGAHT